jgi:cell division protein FtsL
MKQFKRIFYPVYLIMTVWMIYFTIDSLTNIEQTLAWFNEKFSEQNGPFWVMVLYLVMSLLMLIEIVAENVHIHRLKSEIPDLEEEIVRLKAKLFDKGEGVESEEEEDEV